MKYCKWFLPNSDKLLSMLFATITVVLTPLSPTYAQNSPSKNPTINSVSAISSPQFSRRRFLQVTGSTLGASTTGLGRLAGALPDVMRADTQLDLALQARQQLLSHPFTWARQVAALANVLRHPETFPIVSNVSYVNHDQEHSLLQHLSEHPNPLTTLDDMSSPNLPSSSRVSLSFVSDYHFAGSQLRYGSQIFLPKPDIVSPQDVASALQMEIEIAHELNLDLRTVWDFLLSESDRPITPTRLIDEVARPDRELISQIAKKYFNKLYNLDSAGPFAQNLGPNISFFRRSIEVRESFFREARARANKQFANTNDKLEAEPQPKSSTENLQISQTRYCQDLFLQY